MGESAMRISEILTEHIERIGNQGIAANEGAVTVRKRAHANGGARA